MTETKNLEAKLELTSVEGCLIGVADFYGRMPEPTPEVKGTKGLKSLKWIVMDSHRLKTAKIEV